MDNNKRKQAVEVLVHPVGRAAVAEVDTVKSQGVVVNGTLVGRAVEQEPVSYEYSNSGSGFP